MKLLLTIILLLLPFSLRSKIEPYPQVYVKWVDIIATDSGWHSSEEIDEWALTEPDTVYQSGFLYRETKSYIIIIDSFITKDYVGAATKIPRGNIIFLHTDKPP